MTPKIQAVLMEIKVVEMVVEMLEEIPKNKHILHTLIHLYIHSLQQVNTFIHLKIEIEDMNMFTKKVMICNN